MSDLLLIASTGENIERECEGAWHEQLQMCAEKNSSSFFNVSRYQHGEKKKEEKEEEVPLPISMFDAHKGNETNVRAPHHYHHNSCRSVVTVSLLA